MQQQQWPAPAAATEQNENTEKTNVTHHWTPAARAEAGRRAVQVDLFGKPPRRKPHRLMHVINAGNGPGGPVVQFACRCGYHPGRVSAGRLSDDRRGRPCPDCNPADEGEA